MYDQLRRSRLSAFSYVEYPFVVFAILLKEKNDIEFHFGRNLFQLIDSSYYKL